MLDTEVRNLLEQNIASETGRDFIIKTVRSAGGGCINEAYLLEGVCQRFFLKMNARDKLDMLQAEADGLQEILRTGAIRVPRPVSSGFIQQRAFLVLEFIDMGHRGGTAGASQMGRQLAAMHGATTNMFGWHRNNTIGSTPQINDWTDNWIQFFRRQRLGYQISLARQNGLKLKSADRLLDNLAKFFDNYTPAPSLLHGDLWGGNATFDEQGNPVIFDPACYYGDREADLAFTEVFGGFSPAFYQAYEVSWPLDKGYSVRKILYNLYHVLNHFNLFGGYYGAQAKGMIDQLLRKI